MEVWFCNIRNLAFVGGGTYKCMIMCEFCLCVHNRHGYIPINMLQTRIMYLYRCNEVRQQNNVVVFFTYADVDPLFC